MNMAQRLNRLKPYAPVIFAGVCSVVGLALAAAATTISRQQESPFNNAENVAYLSKDVLKQIRENRLDNFTAQNANYIVTITRREQE